MNCWTNGAILSTICVEDQVFTLCSVHWWYNGYYSELWTQRSLVRVPSKFKYSMWLDRLRGAYLSFHPFWVVNWVPEQPYIKAVTGACKFIVSCRGMQPKKLCAATPSVVLSGISPTTIHPHPTTSWGTLSNAFSISTKAIHKFFFYAKYSSCSWWTILHLKYNIVFSCQTWQELM